MDFLLGFYHFTDHSWFPTTYCLVPKPKPHAAARRCNVTQSSIWLHHGPLLQLTSNCCRHKVKLRDSALQRMRRCFVREFLTVLQPHPTPGCVQNPPAKPRRRGSQPQTSSIAKGQLCWLYKTFTGTETLQKSDSYTCSGCAEARQVRCLGGNENWVLITPQEMY